MKIQLRVLVRSRLKSVSDMRTTTLPTGCIVWVNEMISQLCCCGFTVLFNYCKYSYFDIWNTWSRFSYDFLSFFAFFLSLSLNLFHITCDYLSVFVSLCLSLFLSLFLQLSHSVCFWFSISSDFFSFKRLNVKKSFEDRYLFNLKLEYFLKMERNVHLCVCVHCSTNQTKKKRKYYNVSSVARMRKMRKWKCLMICSFVMFARKLSTIFSFFRLLSEFGYDIFFYVGGGEIVCCYQVQFLDS